MPAGTSINSIACTCQAKVDLCEQDDGLEALPSCSQWLTLRCRKDFTKSATSGPPAGPRSRAATPACCAMLDGPEVIWPWMAAAAFAKGLGAARYPSRHPAAEASQFWHALQRRHFGLSRAAHLTPSHVLISNRH